MVVILITIHLYCQAIHSCHIANNYLHCQLIHGCHIANNLLTLSSHTWLSYCEQSSYTVKSHMTVILWTIHLHSQVIHGCHIVNNPFTLSNRKRVANADIYYYNAKSYKPLHWKQIIQIPLSHGWFYYRRQFFLLYTTKSYKILIV